MRHPYLDLEPATVEGFDEAGYLLANPDIAAWVREGGDPLYHLHAHGLGEGRKQVPVAFQRAAADRRRAKYERFAAILDAEAAPGGGDFRFQDAPASFPVLYGTAPHDPTLYDRESANPGLGDFLEEIDRNPDRLYMDVGCGFRDQLQDNCLYLEIYPSRSADIIMAPACTYPIRSGSLDGIGCFAVLEHVTEPWIVAAEFRRMLKPGGLLFIDWPFLQPVHGFPSHYYNATQAGLRRLFDDGYETISLETRGNQTPDRALTWILRGWLAGMTDDAVRQDFLDRTVADLLAEPPRSPFWKAVLAATPATTRATYACGNTLVARKL